MLKGLVTALFLCFICCVSNGQTYTSCKDSTRVQSNSACSSFGYKPVCACNSVTYDNECFSNSAGLLSFTYGICEEFALQLFPNFLTETTVSSFSPLILSKNALKCNFIIMDLFGNIKLNTPINTYFYGNYNIPQNISTFDLSDYHTGMYLCILQSGNYIITKKLFIIK
jgi:hypothetical protein